MLTGGDLDEQEEDNEEDNDDNSNSIWKTVSTVTASVTASLFGPQSRLPLSSQSQKKKKEEDNTSDICVDNNNTDLGTKTTTSTSPISPPVMPPSVNTTVSPNISSSSSTAPSSSDHNDDTTTTATTTTILLGRGETCQDHISRADAKNAFQKFIKDKKRFLDLNDYSFDSEDHTAELVVSVPAEEPLKVMNVRRVFICPLPNGAELSLSVDKERFHCCEVLFQPSINSDEGFCKENSIVNTILRAVEAIDVSVRPDICARIVVFGRTALIPGLLSRLQMELRDRMKVSQSVSQLSVMTNLFLSLLINVYLYTIFIIIFSLTL